MDKKKVILKKGNLYYKDIQEINKLDEELAVECSDKFWCNKCNKYLETV